MAKVARRCDLESSEIQVWLDEGIRGMEKLPWSPATDIREQYEARLKGGLYYLR